MNLEDNTLRFLFNIGKTREIPAIIGIITNRSEKSGKPNGACNFLMVTKLKPTSGLFCHISTSCEFSRRLVMFFL